jgi:hypothetical protein
MKEMKLMNSTWLSFSSFRLPIILFKLMFLECRCTLRLARTKFSCVDPSLLRNCFSNLWLKIGWRKIYSQSKRFLSSL